MRREARGVLLALLLAPLAAPAAGLLEPQPASEDNYGESFTFSTDLDDGSFVQVQLSVTNLGPGARHGICRATVKRPAEKAWTPQVRVNDKEWRYDAATKTLQVAQCTLRETDTGIIAEAPLDKGLVRVELAGKPSAQVPTDVAVGDGRYHHDVLIPFGAAQVTVQAPGAASGDTVEGGGYGDHTRSTIAPAKLARRWLRFRALRGQPRVLVLGREALDSGFGPVYLWQEGGAPRTFPRFELTRTGKKLQTSWQASLPGDTGPMTVRSTQLLHRNAPVEDLGLLGGLVRPVVGSPVTYVLRAVLERPGQKPLDGLMEVSLDE